MIVGLYAIETFISAVGLAVTRVSIVLAFKNLISYYPLRVPFINEGPQNRKTNNIK